MSEYLMLEKMEYTDGVIEYYGVEADSNWDYDTKGAKLGAPRVILTQDEFEHDLKRHNGIAESSNHTGFYRHHGRTGKITRYYDHLLERK